MRDELLMIPGPTPVVKEILEELAQPTVSHTDPRMVKAMRSSLDYTKELFNCDGEVFLISGSGTLAMEMALVNTVAPDDKILIISHGYFGDRFAQLADAFDFDYTLLKTAWGTHIAPEALKAALRADQYQVITITHVDTSTGLEADLELLMPIIGEYAPDALIILDGVCASGGILEDMQKDYSPGKIDLILSGSQKAFGVPPGLSILAFSQKALLKRKKLGKVPAYYADIERWIPVMNDPSKYYATPAVNMVRAFAKAMEIIFTETPAKRFKRHRVNAEAVHAAMSIYGIQPVVDNTEYRASTVTCFRYPDGVEDAEFRKECAARKLILAGGLGIFAGKTFRFGHMGNVTNAELRATIEVIGEVLESLGRGSGVEKALALATFDELSFE